MESRVACACDCDLRAHEIDYPLDYPISGRPDRIIRDKRIINMIIKQIFLEHVSLETLSRATHYSQLRASKKSAGATGDRTQQKTAHQRHAVVCAGGHGNFERLPYIVRLEPGGATHIVRKPKASWNFGSALESAWTAATPTPADRATAKTNYCTSPKFPLYGYFPTHPSHALHVSPRLARRGFGHPA